MSGNGLGSGPWPWGHQHCQQPTVTPQVRSWKCPGGPREPSGQGSLGLASPLRSERSATGCTPPHGWALQGRDRDRVALGPRVSLQASCLKEHGGARLRRIHVLPSLPPTPRPGRPGQLLALLECRRHGCGGQPGAWHLVIKSSGVDCPQWRGILVASEGQPPRASASHLQALLPEPQPALGSCSAPVPPGQRGFLMRARLLSRGGEVLREAWPCCALAGPQGPKACQGG